MEITVLRYTRERIPDVLRFERELREEEDFWNWQIDQNYVQDVEKSFSAEISERAISMLAYDGSRVVGRIDAGIVASHFDGSIKAYLDWICVLKSCRHCGVAQRLMQALREELKANGITSMVGLIAANEEAQHFYRSLPNALIRDQGIWIDIV